MTRSNRIAMAALAALALFSSFSTLPQTRGAEDKPAAAPATEPNTLTPEQQKAGFKLLFDGKDMGYFRNYKGEQINPAWEVKDGAMHLTKGGGGDLVTKEEFGAFELLIDFKISKAGNSGVMFHVKETSGPPYATGPEVQVQDNIDGHDPQKAGWVYQLYPAPQGVDATKPAGEWNTMRILIEKAPNKSEVWMNGTKYSEFVLGSDEWKDRIAKSKFAKMEGFGMQETGHIDLQDHGNEVWFRNIKVREIK
jgi:Domain of Unknown Function (DUF1080)